MKNKRLVHCNKRNILLKTTVVVTVLLLVISTSTILSARQLDETKNIEPLYRTILNIKDASGATHHFHLYPEKYTTPKHPPFRQQKMMPMTAQERSTVYVNDDNVEGPWDGTLQHPYRYIQDGIDHASSYDTVFVFSGTYKEHISIHVDHLLVLGEDKNTTSIIGSGIDTIVQITADSITLNGFCIQKSGTNDYDSGVALWSENNIIFDNMFLDDQVGVLLFNTGMKNNTIQSNIFLDTVAGIVFQEVTSNKFIGNTFQDLAFGIYGEQSSMNLIRENTFSKISETAISIFEETDDHIQTNTFTNIGIGIVSALNANVSISNNVFTDIVSKGVFSLSDQDILISSNIFQCIQVFGTGILIGDAMLRTGEMVDHQRIDISYNSLINSFDGKGIDDMYSTSDKIIGNNITELRYAMSFFYPQHTIISGNTITNTGGDGIGISQGSYNIITNNNLRHNGYRMELSGHGILLIADMGEPFEQNIISNNTITENWGSGICIRGEDPNTESFPHHNLISNNMCSGNGYGWTDAGISIIFSKQNTIINNRCFQNKESGIHEYWSNNNTFIQNNCSSNVKNGFFSITCQQSLLDRNTFSDQDKGVVLTWYYYPSSKYQIYHNTFLRNIIHASDDNSLNTWDNGYTSGGNYWDDYTGIDENQDGIGDTPYNISGGSNQDLYPLMTPYIVDTIPPTMTISKPEEGSIYLLNHELMKEIHLKNALIIGRITIEIDVVDYESGVGRVEIYIDDLPKATITEPPFQWTWKEKAFFNHSLKVVAYDKNENSALETMKVWKFL